MLTLQNDAAVAALSGNGAMATSIQHQTSLPSLSPSSSSSASTQKPMTSESRTTLGDENKTQNVEQVKNQLMNFGSHEKLSHNDVQYQEQLKQEHQQQSQPQSLQQHQQQQQQTKQAKPLGQQQVANANVDTRVSPKNNCFSLPADLVSTDDNAMSGSNQQQQHHHHHHHHQSTTNDNCSPPTPLAVNLKLNAVLPTTATSPLIENGGSSISVANNNVTAFMQDKLLPSSTTSPSDLRKELDAKANGKLVHLFESFDFARNKTQECFMCHLSGIRFLRAHRTYPLA